MPLIPLLLRHWSRRYNTSYHAAVQQPVPTHSAVQIAYQHVAYPGTAPYQNVHQPPPTHVAQVPQMQHYPYQPPQMHAHTFNQYPPPAAPPHAPRGDMPRGDMPRGDMPRGDMPRGDMPRGDMPRGDMPPGFGMHTPILGTLLII